MNKSELDLTAYSINFPSVIADGLDRSNFINLIKDNFSDENKIIFVDGKQGVGKTYLLSKFAKDNSNNCISVFVNNRDRSSFEPRNFEFDISNQLNMLLYGKEIDDNAFETDKIIIHSIIFKRHLSKTKKPFYFVFDGLENISELSVQSLRDIFSQLPLSTPNIYCLFSGDKNKIRKNLSCISHLSSFELSLTQFSLDETKLYLEKISPDMHSYAQEIYNITYGNAFKLSFIKRLVASGKPINKIIKGGVDIDDLLEYDWNDVDQKNENLLLVIGVVAFSDHKIKTDIIEFVSGFDKKTIKDLLENISFIKSSNTDVVTFEFINDYHKNYAKKKLNYIERKVNDRLIEFYLIDSSNSESMQTLISFYEKHSNWEDVVKLLSAKNLNTLVEKSHSIRPMLNLTEKAIKASSEIKKYEELFKYNLYKSILEEHRQMDIWESEIEAKTKLGEYNEALRLAQSTFLVEDRLKLLTLIARKIKEKEGCVETSLIQEIEETYAVVSFEKLEDSVIDIATNLMYSCPELAINLVEKTGRDTGGNTLDTALAKISLALMDPVRRERDNRPENEETISTEISSRIKNIKIKNLVEGIKYFGKNNSQNDILNIVEKVDKASEKLFFLRNWIKINYRLADTNIVLSEALNIIFKHTDYVVNASVAKDLALGLRTISDINAIKDIIARFESLEESLIKRGPTKDYIICMLYLSEAEILFDPSKAFERILNLYYSHINQISEPVTKAECISVFIRNVARIVKKENDDLIKEVIIEADAELGKIIEMIIRDCAHQGRLLKYVIKALAVVSEDYVRKVYELIKKLNTENNRDECFTELFINYLNNEDNYFSEELLNEIFNKIGDIRIKQLIISEILDKIIKEKETKISEKLLKIFLNEVDLFVDGTAKCYCLVRFYKINFLENYINVFDVKELKDKLYVNWLSIDPAASKIEIAFRISADLVGWDDEFALEYNKHGEEVKKKTFLDSPKRADILESILRLVISSFAGLVAKGTYNENDYEKIKSNIGVLPSVSSQMIMWGELASRVHRNGNENFAKEIVKNEIKPNIKYLSETEVSRRSNIFLNIAPILYLYHKETLLIDIDKYIHSSDKDIIYWRVIEYILTKCTLTERCDFNYVAQGISYEEFLDCLVVLEKIEDDALIYRGISLLTDSIVKHKGDLTEEQKADLYKKAEKIVAQNLPQNRNIQHDGYVIVCLAQLYRIGKTKLDKWQMLFKRSENIPNISDQIFVMINILKSMCEIRRSEFDGEKISRVSSILKNIERMPFLFEKVDRLSLLLPVVKEIERSKCSYILTKIVDIINVHGELVSYEKQKEIVDFAYGLSPELAESLIEKFDDDPARLKYKEQMKNRINFLKNRESLFEKEDMERKKEINYPSMCHSLLEALYSQKLGSKPLKMIEPIINEISNYPISESISVSMYVVENTVTQYKKTPSSETILRNIFEATMFCCELVGYLGKKTINYNKPISISEDESYLIIANGDDKKAIDFIKKWAVNNLINDMVIIDPYFGPNDLFIIKELMEINAYLNVTVLTSLKHNKEILSFVDFENRLRESWKNISIEKSPSIKMVFVGNEKDGQAPFHDRWWIVNEGQTGIRIGTSVNSMGKNRLSEISILSKEQAQNINFEVVQQFAEKNVRNAHGNKWNYKTFHY